MNWKCLLLGGGLAGLIFNVGGMMSAFLMALPATFARFGVEPTPTAALLHVSLRFGLGVASVVAYVGLRCAFGPGARAALGAGFLIWFVGYVPGTAILHELGVLSGAQLTFALGWGAVEAVGATLAGAGLCRRGDANVPAGAA